MTSDENGAPTGRNGPSDLRDAAEHRARVYRAVTASASFSELDRAVGVGAPVGDSSLERWYRERRSTAIAELSLADLCRSVRQRIHWPVVARYAAELLGRDLWAGAAYPGELLASFEAAAGGDFEAWPELGRALSALGRRALAEGHGAVVAGMDGELWAEVSTDVRAWVARASAVAPSEPALTIDAGAGMEQPMTILLARSPEITVGSAPSCTIFRPQPASGLARTHAILTLETPERLRVDALHHGGALNGVPFAGRVVVELGSSFELGRVRFRFHRGGEEVAAAPWPP